VTKIGYLQQKRTKNQEKGGKIGTLFLQRGLLYVTVLNFYINNYKHLFGTATYIDYLTFSHLNSITNPTPLPNATLTMGATKHNPDYQGSRVYLDYRVSRTQP
jgi:hypothetical protein